MRILAIETSTPKGTVALLDRKNAIREEHEFESHRAHNARIFAPLDEMRTRHCSPVDLVVIGSGPGSYSGIRVGIAVANGIAMADGCPAIALPSITALDAPAGDNIHDFDVIGDARRGSFFHARIRKGELVSHEHILLDEDAFRSSVQETHHPVFTTDKVSPHPDAIIAHPRASILAALAANLAEDRIAELAPLALQPIYLRAPFTTKAKKKPFPAS